MVRPRKPLLIGLLILILAGTTGAFLIFRLSRARGELTFQTYLQRVDSYLAGGHADSALRSLREASGLARGGHAILSVCKRAYRIALQAGDMSVLSAFAASGLKKIPDSPELLFFAAYAALRSDRPRAALGILNGKRTTAELTMLKAEAVWRTGEMSLMPSEAGELGAYAKAVAAPTVDLYEGLWRETGDERLLVDAALMHMRDGAPQRALSLGRQGLQQPRHDRMMAHIAYDAGDYDLAIERLRKFLLSGGGIPEERLMLADLYGLTHDYSRAGQLYRELVSNNPLPAAYLNLAYIYTLEGLPLDALAVLEDGYARFPENERLAVELARKIRRSGDPADAGPADRPPGRAASPGAQNALAEARDILTRHLTEHPDSQAAAILLLDMNWAGLLPRHYKARLWEIHNRAPQNALLSRHISWYLMGFEDIESVELVLDSFERSGGETSLSWYRHMRALVHALRGEYSQSLASFEASLAIEESCATRYNRSQLLRALGDRKGAGEDLQAAAATCGEDPRMGSIVYARMAEDLFQDGNMEGAWRQLQHALELNPENDRARLLVKQLEKSD